MSYGTDGTRGGGRGDFGGRGGPGGSGRFGGTGRFSGAGWYGGLAGPGGQPGQPGPPAAPLRATDRDRDATVSVLQACYTEGRLDKDEHDLRVGRALTAQTYADLDSLTTDLPQRPVYPDAPVMPVMAGRRRTNGYAVAALVCGLAQPFTGGLSTIPAIAFGHVARGQIRRTGDDGKAMATWGLALGWAGIAFVLLLVLGLIAAFGVYRTTSPG